MGEQEAAGSASSLDPPQMALVLRQQALELVKQLLGHRRRTSKFPKVRNDSPLRFNVALALGNMALRHFQFGLAVHLGASIPKARGRRSLFPWSEIAGSQWLAAG